MLRRNLLHGQGQVRLADIFLRRQSDAHIPFPSAVSPAPSPSASSSTASRACFQVPRRSPVHLPLGNLSLFLTPPELLRFSSRHTLLSQIPEELQRVHRQDQIAAAQDAPKAFVNSAKSRAIARADKKTAARAAGSGTTAILPTAAAAASAVLDLWGEADDAGDVPFLDLNDASLSSLGL